MDSDESSQERMMAPPDKMDGIPKAMLRFADNAVSLARDALPKEVAGRGGGQCGGGMNGHEEVLAADNETTVQLYEFLTRFKEATSALGLFAHKAGTSYHFTDDANQRDIARAAFDDYTRTAFAGMTGEGLPRVLPSLESPGNE
ncbi:hypothetical protein [Amycolatopsis sp. NPDC058986]|uniref:hypothetical protein n=1 Tax=unclassified Amycolatopsis TaxID=2618356 RepID=UPI0036726F8A